MKKLFHNQAIRYIFFGGCTTLVNLFSYYLLCTAGVNITVANTLAILLAILFAYVVNKLFVFEHRAGSFAGLLKEAGSFIGMRLGTMVVEVLGVLCLICIWGMPNMPAKLVIQVVILVLNYLISRFVVFKMETPPPEVAAGRTAQLRTLRVGAVRTSRRYFLAGFGLSALVALAGLALLGVWPFGDKTLLIIDSLHQYLPFYTVFHEKLVSNESFLYSFSGGLGYNFWSTYAYYMASPLNFLMAFIPTENVCDFMDLMILLKIGLCGGCFSWYMHKRDTQRKYLPVAFGLMYALSNFVIGYYFNLMWLDSIAMLPLVMYGIEQIVNGKSGRCFCLSLFYGLWCNYYIGYMLCVFSCLYFLVRWIARTGVYTDLRRARCAAELQGEPDWREAELQSESDWREAELQGKPDSREAELQSEPNWRENENRPGQRTEAGVGFWRELGRSCLNFAWHALLAGGMAALVLLPAFLGLTSTESMDGNTFPATVKFYEGLAELLENQMAFMEPVTISSTQVGLNIYCGVATVLLAILYLFDRKIRLRERLAHYGLIALLLFSFSCNIPNYIWHGFHTQNGLPNRFAFIYVAVLLTMAYDALGHLKDFWLPKLLFAAAVPIAFLILRRMEPEQELDPYLFLISIGLLVLYFAIFLIQRYAPWLKPSVFSAVLTIILVIELTANAIYGFSSNGSVTRSIYLADQSSYKTMIADTDEAEDSFYRSEVDRQRMRNVTMYVGGNALVMFNSTMQNSVIDFCDALGIEARTNKNGYLGVTKLMNDVFGIKYLASPSAVSDTMYQFVRMDEDRELVLYKNENALSLGFMVKDDILGWDISSGEPLSVQNSFVELATGLEPIFVLDRTIDMENEGNYWIRIPENKQVYLCIDTRVEEIKMNTPEYSKTFSTYTDHLYVINSSDTSDLADFTATLKSTQTTVQAEVYTCSNEAYQAVIDKLSESQLENVCVDGNTVSGSVDVKEAGTLLLTIPYDSGWTVLVDGKQAEVSIIGETLMGVHLTEGAHAICMKYTPPGLWIGSGISLLAAALFLFTIAWEKRHLKYHTAAVPR